MKKWIGPFFSILLVLILVVISFPFYPPEKLMLGKEKKGEPLYLVGQSVEREEKREEIDSHYLQILKKLQEQLDEWLKSLNQRIESQDITRFEVRFLEILRNILEWMKEKIDAKIEAYEKDKPLKKRKDLLPGTLDTHAPFSVKG